MDFLFGLDRVSAHDDNVELLTTVYNPVELSILRSILEGEGIPYMIKERGCGNSVKIFAGYTMLGSDVFVPVTAIEEAKALLDAYQNGTIVEDEGAEEEGDA